MTKWVRSLLIANVVVYFLQRTLGDGFTSAFMLVPSLALTRPWTVVTYMFLHDPYGFSHIVFNMFGLWIFGPPVESRLGSNRFIWLYMLAGLGGAAFSFMFAYRAAVIGASGALYGVMLAYAYFWPRDRMMIWGILPVEARVLVVIYTLLALFGGVTGGGTTAHFAHLGGFAAGFLYLKWIDSTQGSRKFRKAVQPKISERALVNWKKVDPKTVHEVNRDELNRILDKVGRGGLSSLTPDEKRFLMSFVPPDDRPPMVS
jgi:membrane associated rhomboid family serine protease